MTAISSEVSTYQYNINAWWPGHPVRHVFMFWSVLKITYFADVLSDDPESRCTEDHFNRCQESRVIILLHGDGCDSDRATEDH